MTIFMNLDQIPTGHHHYTAYLACDLTEARDGSWEAGDEIDFTANSRLEGRQLERAARESDEFVTGYEPVHTAVAGIVDNTTGYIVFDARDALGIPKNDA